MSPEDFLTLNSKAIGILLDPPFQALMLSRISSMSLFSWSFKASVMRLPFAWCHFKCKVPFPEHLITQQQRHLCSCCQYRTLCIYPHKYTDPYLASSIILFFKRWSSSFSYIFHEELLQRWNMWEGKQTANLPIIQNAEWIILQVFQRPWFFLVYIEKHENVKIWKYSKVIWKILKKI